MSSLSLHPSQACDRLPVLFVTGAPATGKSVTAWEVFQRHDEQVAFVDIDQLKMLFPEQVPTEQLAIDNLRVLTEVHRTFGTRALIVAGVLDVESMRPLQEALGEGCDLTWCVMDADETTLRSRVAERGWPEDLVDAVVAEAAAWRSVRDLIRLDSSHLSLDEAAASVDGLLHLRPAVACGDLGTPVSLPELVVLHGPRAVGKSTVAWQLFMSQSDQSPTGFLDADQLGFVHAPAEVRDAIVFHCVSGLAATFAAAGAVRTIVNGNLSLGLLESLSGERTVTVALDARLEVLRQRVERRAAGDGGARLTGDDLVGATDERRAAVLADAVEHQAQLRSCDLVSHRFIIGGPDPTAVVTAIQALIPGEQPGVVADGDRSWLGDPPADGIDGGACCVIITGAPAVGKTTLTRRLAQTLGHSAWLNGDQIHGVVVGGRVWALGEPKPEADRQTWLGNQNLVSVARNCAEAGFTPVIDWIIPDAGQLAQFTEGLAPLPVWLIVLDPGACAAKVRNLQREDRFDFDGYEQLVGGMKREFGSRAWWLDSSQQTEDETFALICARAGVGTTDVRP